MGTRAKRALVVGLAAVVVAGLGSTAALAEESYADPSGDSQTAVDLTSVTVGDQFGKVAIRLSWAGGQPLPADDTLWVMIDTDNNADTGDEDGQEVELEFDGNPADPNLGTWSYSRWDGTTMNEDAQASGSSFAVGGKGMMAFVLDRVADLNGSKTMRFWAYADQYDANNTIIAEDAAPDGTGVYTYAFADVGAAISLKASRAVGVPAAPVAGKRFSVDVQLARTDAEPLTGVVVTCAARVGSASVRAAGSFANGTVHCRLTVPKRAKGKILHGAVVARLAGAGAVSATPFSFRIR